MLDLETLGGGLSAGWSSAGKAYYRTSSASAPAYFLWDIIDGMTGIEGTEAQSVQTTDDDGWYTVDKRQLTGKPAQ